MSTMAWMWAWIQDHNALLIGLGFLSAVCFAAGLVSLPLLVAWIPDDYFSTRPRCPHGAVRRSGWTRIARLIIRNLLGYVLILAGLIMLILPGQGILTMVIGLILIDLPGKRRLVRWIIAWPSVRKSIDWLRRRQGRPPLNFGR